MICPKCKYDDIKTRRTFPGNPIRREKNCKSCGMQFFTLEHLETDLNHERTQWQQKLQKCESEKTRIEREFYNVKMTVKAFFDLKQLF